MSNDFKVFCNGAPGTANALTPAAYAALTDQLVNGFQEGTALSVQANSVWRQATTAMAVLGDIISRGGYSATDNGDFDTLAVQLLTSLATLLPSPHQPGDIKIAAYMAPSTGWTLCDGTSLLRASYPALFAVLGTTWGSADINHFSVPDLRGLHIRGFDNGRGIDDPGRTLGSYQPDQMPEHVHIVDLQPLNSNSFSGFGKLATGNESPEGVIPPFNTGSAGTGSETRVKNMAMNYFIYNGLPTFTFG